MNVFLHGTKELGVVAGLEVIPSNTDVQLVPGLQELTLGGPQGDESHLGGQGHHLVHYQRQVGRLGCNYILIVRPPTLSSVFIQLL